jgi:hypothetical protein
MARRLELAGLSFMPAWFHTAYVVRARFRFVDSVRQGRFEALLRDLAEIPLKVASQAIAEGRVLLDGEPYVWEPAPMVFWLDGRAVEEAEVEAERGRVRFTLGADEPAARLRS